MRKDGNKPLKNGFITYISNTGNQKCLKKPF